MWDVLAKAELDLHRAVHKDAGLCCPGETKLLLEIRLLHLPSSTPLEEVPACVHQKSTLMMSSVGTLEIFSIEDLFAACIFSFSLSIKLAM